MTSVVLGLDGGGTKVIVQAATLDGAVVGEGWSGPCNIAFMPLEEAFGNAVAACAGALAAAGASVSDVRAVCAGVAGTSFLSRRAEFLGRLQGYFLQAAVTVEPDYAIALTGATEGQPGMIVIAGTGSVAYGENAAGQFHKSGAYGYLIDDGGSGYGVGRAALAAVLRMTDGTGAQTTLAERLMAVLGLGSVAEIIPSVYGGTLDRVTIASLSRVVAEAAAQDADPVAQGILMRAGGALAQLAQSVARQIFFDSTDPFPVVEIGSLWQAGEALTDVFARSLQRFAPQAVIAAPRYSPVFGAVIRARAAAV